MPLGTSRPTSAHSISAGAKSTRAYRAALRLRPCGELLSVSRPYRRLTPASGAKPRPNGGPLPQCISVLYPMGIYTYPPYRCRSQPRRASPPGDCTPAADAPPALNKPLQSVLSEFVRRTRTPLPAFVELLRGQSADDYRPNKNMVPRSSSVYASVTSTLTRSSISLTPEHGYRCYDPSRSSAPTLSIISPLLSGILFSSRISVKS